MPVSCYFKVVDRFQKNENQDLEETDVIMTSNTMY